MNINPMYPVYPPNPMYLANPANPALPCVPSTDTTMCTLNFTNSAINYDMQHSMQLTIQPNMKLDMQPVNMQSKLQISQVLPKRCIPKNLQVLIWSDYSTIVATCLPL